jgi:hypothetical protein
MKDPIESTRPRSEKIQRVLMVWGALILFVLGFLLLLTPGRRDGAHSMGTSDNEMHRSGTTTCYDCAGFQT